MDKVEKRELEKNILDEYKTACINCSNLLYTSNFEEAYGRRQALYSVLTEYMGLKEEAEKIFKETY